MHWFMEYLVIIRYNRGDVHFWNLKMIDVPMMNRPVHFREIWLLVVFGAKIILFELNFF